MGRLRVGDETWTVPVRATRPMSFRTRSTIMMFSAVSFSRRSPTVRPVPLIGEEGWREAEEEFRQAVQQRNKLAP